MAQNKRINDETISKYEGTTLDEIHINDLLYSVLIIKAENLDNSKIFLFADHLEKQLRAIKRGDKVLEL